MFGKPEWFRPKRWGWGLSPVTWQGWLYTLAVAVILAGPFVLLISRGQTPEALIWFAAALAVLVWDVKQTLAAMGHGCRRSAPAANDAQHDSSPTLPDAPTSGVGNTFFAKHFRCCTRR